MTRAMEPTTGPAIHASLFLDEVELIREIVRNEAGFLESLKTR